jgi:hypothetical protein
VRKSFVILVAGLALAGFGGAAAPAQAANCSFNYEQPFYAWSDVEWYGLAPGSNFPTARTPSGWTLANKATVVAGGNPNRPWSSDYSLSIPANGSATTPAFCVDQYSPYSRMFGYTTTTNATGAPGLKVEVIYTNSAGRSTTTNVANLAQLPEWSPTEQFPLVGGTVAPKWNASGQATVKYKFTAINGTAWRIDDLFIDPKRH